MQSRTADGYVYGALFLATSLYALLLDYNKRHARRKLEPDWTWLEVAIGVALCLAAGAGRARLDRPRTPGSTERAYLLACITGGMPIVCWQICRTWQRHEQRAITLQHFTAKDATRYATPPTGQRPPAGLADLRAPRTRAD